MNQKTTAVNSIKHPRNQHKQHNQTQSKANNERKYKGTHGANSKKQCKSQKKSNRLNLGDSNRRRQKQ